MGVVPVEQDRADPEPAGTLDVVRIRVADHHGLVGPDAGRVLLDDRDMTHEPMYVRARAGIGYLPQEASIFRGLTVEQNLLAILETLKQSASERRERLRELLAELNLTPLAKSKAYNLSGGERRRAEITRAQIGRAHV